MATLAPLSACVTRILSLSGFAPELKTRDIQQAFSDWENVSGGFKIKWQDDTSLFIVFNDPTVAKRAYLQAIYKPPAVFTSPKTPRPARLRPYDGPDAQTVIAAVQSRGGGGGGGHVRGHSSRASIAVGGGINGAHARMGSMSVSGNGNGNGNGNGRSSFYQGDTNIHTSTSAHPLSIPLSSSGLAREPSPTLPSLPTQPALSSLISSSLSAGGSGEVLENNSTITTLPGPKIGDPGRRMVAHSLGVKHPSLSRSQSGGDISRGSELQNASLTE